MFPICLILTSLMSYFFASLFNIGLLFFLSFFAFIILNIEFLSLIRAISDVNILITTLIEFVIISFFWFKKGKPKLKINYREFFSDFKKLLIKDKTFIFLSAGWVILVVTAFLLSYFCTVNEPDAQTYQALRVLFWAKDGFISHFDTVDVRNICMPFNSGIFYLWIFLLNKSDTMYGFLQFFSYFSLILTSYKIMEMYEIEFEKRLWAIFLFSSLAGIIIQISSTQTDIVTGALIMLSCYLVCLYKNKGKSSILFLASLSMGISFGVKTTSFMMSIPVLLWFIVILKKDFLKYFAMLFLNSVIFSSYAYILNYLDFGNFFSSNAFIMYNKFVGGYKTFIANIIQYLIQMFDFSGLNLSIFLEDYILQFQNRILSMLNLPKDYTVIDAYVQTTPALNEQTSAFGILGFFVFLPCAVISLFNKKLRLWGVIFWSSFFILCASMLYTIYGIRYIAGFVCLGIPVLSLSYFKKFNVLKFLIVIYMLFYMGYASMFLRQRPFLFLAKEVIKDGIVVVQDKIRKIQYPFNNAINSIYSMEYYEAAKPYCKDGNKIAFFPNGSSLLYLAKYLELNNDCKIDTLSPVHISNYDLTEYKAVIIELYTQATDFLSKNDLKNPIANDYRVACNYYVSERAGKFANSIEGTIKAECQLNPYYLQILGFKKAFIKEPYEGVENEYPDAVRLEVFENTN